MVKKKEGKCTSVVVLGNSLALPSKTQNQQQLINSHQQIRLLHQAKSGLSTLANSFGETGFTEKNLHACSDCLNVGEFFLCLMLGYFRKKQITKISLHGRAKWPHGLVLNDGVVTATRTAEDNLDHLKEFLYAFEPHNSIAYQQSNVSRKRLPITSDELALPKM